MGWENCSTADCEFKVCLWLSKTQCYGCHFGLSMTSMEKYLAQPALSDEDWNARHQMLLAQKADKEGTKG